MVKNYNPFFINIGTDRDIRTGLNLTPFWQFLTSEIVRTVLSLCLPHAVSKFQLNKFNGFRVKSKSKNFQQKLAIFTQFLNS